MANEGEGQSVTCRSPCACWWGARGGWGGRGAGDEAEAPTRTRQRHLDRTSPLSPVPDSGSGSGSVLAPVSIPVLCFYSLFAN